VLLELLLGTYYLVDEIINFNKKYFVSINTFYLKLRLDNRLNTKPLYNNSISIEANVQQCEQLLVIVYISIYYITVISIIINIVRINIDNINVYNINIMIIFINNTSAADC